MQLLALLETVMQKRSRSPGCLESLPRNCVELLTEKLAISVQSTPSWKRMQQTCDELWSKIEALEIQRRILLLAPRPGGSKVGRKIIKRDFEKAFNTLMIHYFVAKPMYPDVLFRKRFRVAKQIFERVYCACLKHPCFEHNMNAASRRGIHPLVKVTACFRHLAYGTSADQLDELFQIAESTFLETRQAFCDVRFLMLTPKLTLTHAHAIRSRSCKTLMQNAHPHTHPHTHPRASSPSPLSTS